MEEPRKPQDQDEDVEAHVRFDKRNDDTEPGFIRRGEDGQDDEAIQEQGRKAGRFT